MLQKNVLFSGTVRENLKWGDRSADDDTLWAACRMACADEFLERMPKGLDTDLGQGGVNVSGGQKQRLCIARTLLKHPKILIFDDSTSAVDTATEAKIRSALAQLRDVTKIVIAQRVTSVMEADQIIILEDGRVHAVGTHASLLASRPHLPGDLRIPDERRGRRCPRSRPAVKSPRTCGTPSAPCWPIWGGTSSSCWPWRCW